MRSCQQVELSDVAFSALAHLLLPHLFRFCALKSVHTLCCGEDAERQQQLSRRPSEPTVDSDGEPLHRCVTAGLLSTEGTVCLSSRARPHDIAHADLVMCWPRLLDLEHR